MINTTELKNAIEKNTGLTVKTYEDINNLTTSPWIFVCHFYCPITFREYTGISIKFQNNDALLRFKFLEDTGFNDLSSEKKYELICYMVTLQYKYNFTTKINSLYD